nr:BRCT domain-containing protein [Variovorax boronicumulans]
MDASALYTRQAAAFRNEMRQTCAALVGITQGILADGQLHDREVHFLNDWLAQAETVSLLWPGSVIHAQVKQILADGVITAEERQHLTKTLEALLGGALDDLATAPRVTTLAFDDAPQIEYRERSFCFTGDFAFGPRSACEKAVVLRGGTIANVTKKLHYLVVGGLGSAEWKHGVFGTKIEKAIEHKQSGLPLKIVHEDAWASALGA